MYCFRFLFFDEARAGTTRLTVINFAAWKLLFILVTDI